MIELTEKYVFHIPLYKYIGGVLVPIELSGLLDDLIEEFGRNGFDSLYMTKVKSSYKSHLYDEILITIFTSKGKSPCEIFENWFRRNNHLLMQESYAYEYADSMIINELQILK